MYVGGLATDYLGNKFGQLLDLVPFADVVEKIKGTCDGCG